MTEVVGDNWKFSDLILQEEFDHDEKIWRCFLVIPQDYLEDLFGIRHAIGPREAYDKAPEFWNRLSERTRDSYLEYIRTQTMPRKGSIRRQWFQWNDFDRLERAYNDFRAGGNQPFRLSVLAREPVA
jgi:hypothetical protein